MTRMLRVIAIVVALVALAVGSTFAQKGYDLFQQGLAKERAEGKPQEAIALYQQAIKEAGSDRALVAKALVQMAGCYDKIKSPEARKTYQRVVDEFSDQTEMVAQAKARLAPVAAPKADTIPASSLYVEPMARPVTLPAGRLSPDGQFVAFTENSSRDLVVRTVASGEARRPVARTAPELVVPRFAWSSDSKRLAYAVCDKSQCDLRVIGIDGTGETTVLPRSSGDIRVFDWSADGRSIAVEIDQNRAGVWMAVFGLVSIADGSVRELKTFVMNELWCSDTPGFSPDGRYLAYGWGGYNEPCDLFVLATDGSGERPLIRHPADDNFLTWTPDGDLLFTSDRSGTKDIWLAHVEDGRVDGLPQRLKRDVAVGGTGGGVIGLTADGALYYRTPSTSSSDVYVASLDPSGHLLSSPAPVTPSNILKQGVTWSPDGRLLTLTTRASDTKNYDTVTVVSLDTGEERHIRPQPRLDGIQGGVAWTPDGRSFFLNGRVADQWDVYKVDAQTSEAQALGIGLQSKPWVSTSMRLLPDGRTAVYSAGGTAIVALNLETREEHTVYSAAPGWSASGPDLSPDGKRITVNLASSAKKTRTVMIVDLASGNARQVIQLPTGGGGRVAWSPDGQFLIYGQSQQAEVNRVEAWRVSADGGQPEKVGLVVDGTMQELTMHPDGRHLAFQVTRSVPAGVFVLDRLVPGNDRPAASIRRAPQN